MKYLFIGVFTLLCLFACQSNDSKYIKKAPYHRTAGWGMDLSGTHGKRLNRKYRFYENRERTVYFQGTGEEM